MSGFAKGGVVIADGANLAIQGKKPSGMAVQGKQMWKSSLWQLLNFANGNSAGTANATLNTTGSNLIAVFAGANVSPICSDSQNNTWNQIALTSSTVSRIFYCINPVTSANHVINVGNSYVTFIVAAFHYNGSGTLFLDQTSSGVATPPTIQLGAITPSSANSLVITGAGNGYQPFTAIDSDFSIIDLITYSAAWQVAAAYYVTSNTTSLAPTWTFSGNYQPAATLASFIPSPWKFLTWTQMVNQAVSSPINTTGATLLVVVVISFYGSASIGDSQGNSWIAGVYAGPGGNGANNYIFYCLNPITSTSHTFWGAAASYTTNSVMAFSGPASVIVDQSSSVKGTSGTSITSAPLMPTAPSSLIIAGSCNNGIGNVASVDGGFTLISNVTGGAFMSGGSAFLMQSVNTTVAPTWTFTADVTGSSAAAMLNFIATPPWRVAISTAAGPLSGGGTTTTPAVDTTGVDLLVMTVSNIAGASSMTIADSQNNTWVQGPSSASSGYMLFSYYCIHPNTSTAHTFSTTLIGNSIDYTLVEGYKAKPGEIVTVGPSTVASTNGNNVTSLQLPPLTISSNNLIITSVMHGYNITSIDSQFILTINGAAGTWYGSGALAHRIGYDATSLAPTWTFAQAFEGAAVMLSFKLS